MGRVHDLDSSNSSLFMARRAKEARANGKDWGRIQQMYQPAVIEAYRRAGLAERGLPFAYALQKGLLKASIERHGLFRSFKVHVRAFRDALPDGTKPWLSRGLKLALTVHPEDPDFFARLSQHVSGNFQPIDSDSEMIVTLVSASKSGVVIDQSTPKSVALGLLMNSQPYDFVAVVVRGSGKRGAKLEEEFAPRRAKAPAELIQACRSPSPKRHRRRAKRRHAHKDVKPVRESLEERNLPPIAHHISEQIAAQMSNAHRAAVHLHAGGAKKAVKHASKKLIRDQLFVSKAVQAAVLNDDLYKQHGAASAVDYYRTRNINIAHVINEFTVQIQKELKGIDSSPMFSSSAAPIGAEMGSSTSSVKTSSVLNEEASKKIFHSAVIGVCLLDKFKEWTGYSGKLDDGGPDQGASASLSFRRSTYRSAAFVPANQPVVRPPVHARAYCADHTVDEPAVVEDSTGPNIVSQQVIVRRSEDHHEHKGHACKNHKKAYECSSGDESSSSDEEERLLNRAHRKKHGSVTSSSDSSSSSDSESKKKKKEKKHKKSTEVAVTHTHHKDIVVKTPEKTIIMHEEEQHSNFIKVLREAKINFDIPVLILAPHDSVFNNENLEAVVRAVKTGKKSFRDFVLNYIVRIGEPKNFETVCSHKQHIKLVSQGKVVFELEQPGRRLLVSNKFRGAFKPDEPRLRLSDKLFNVKGYPDHVQFVTLRVLHQSFPKEA